MNSVPLPPPPPRVLMTEEAYGLALDCHSMLMPRDFLHLSTWDKLVVVEALVRGEALQREGAHGKVHGSAWEPRGVLDALARVREEIASRGGLAEGREVDAALRALLDVGRDRGFEPEVFPLTPDEYFRDYLPARKRRGLVLFRGQLPQGSFGALVIQLWDMGCGKRLAAHHALRGAALAMGRAGLCGELVTRILGLATC